jgi:GNAT superfamily N-acetyltransferase
MSESAFAYATTPIEPADVKAGFTCGKHPLDDYFARHAVANDAAGISRAYVLRRGSDAPATFPAVLGFYTLSMALADSAQVAKVLEKKLPKYPMPVALIGRLAIEQRAQGRRLGEKLLMDALRRVVDAASILGCTGIIVDAKDEDAERFYAKYDFVTVTDEGWPRRMFLPIGTARAAFAEG